MNEATQEQGAILERLEGFLGGEEALPVEETPEEIEKEVSEPDEPEGEEESEDSEVESEDAIDQEAETLDLSDLAEYLKLDADKLDIDDEGNLYIKTKVDGEEGQATLNDLIKSYQLEGHLNKQNMEVQSLKKELETKRQEIEQQAQERLGHLESLTALAYQELVGEYQSTDWQDLRMNDPAEYAARQAEFNQRNNQIQQAMQQVESEKRNQESATNGRTKEQLAKEAEKLLNVIPEWKDPTIADKERAELRTFALNVGYNEHEIANLSDHRTVLLLRDAMKYRQLQDTKPSVKNRVKKAPKLAKPGAPKAQKELAKRKVDQIKQTVKKSGGKKGVMDYLLTTGKV